MTHRPILLTSFRPWKAHQAENSSEAMLSRLVHRLPHHVRWLQDLIVNFELAPVQVIAQVQQYRPKLVICCGMAEKRKHLTVERWGKGKTEKRATRLDLEALVTNTVDTHISEDAGSFVCNSLYYRLLAHVQTEQPQTYGLFVHVPKLSAENWPVIEFDFLRLVQRLDELL